MQPLSGNQRPDLLTCLIHVSLVLRLPREVHLCSSSSNVPPRTFYSLLASYPIPRFLNISTSASAPRMVCFLNFDLEILALAAYVWKCASRHSSVHFFAQHVLHAKTACNCSSLIQSDGSSPTRFSEPTFRPSGLRSHKQLEKYKVRDSSTFSRTCIFFLLTLSLIWPSFFFPSLLFSDSSHLCFSSVHIVGSLTSKLPSTITISYPQLSPFLSVSINLAVLKDVKLKISHPAPSSQAQWWSETAGLQRTRTTRPRSTP